MGRRTIAKKRRLLDSYKLRKKAKSTRQKMIELRGRQWVEDVERRENSRRLRRRNYVKARRFIIKANCLECRLEYLPQLDTGETFGVSTTKK